MKKETEEAKPTCSNLDDLLEVLDQDALRHVYGGRPKGKVWCMADGASDTGTIDAE